MKEKFPSVQNTVGPLLTESENFVGVYTVNNTKFLSELKEVLDAYSQKGYDLEVGDLANEIGLMLGRSCPNTKALLSDFMRGLEHGLELSKTE